MKLFTNLSFSVLLISSILLSKILCRDDEAAKEARQNRLFSCIKLTNVMIQEDKDYLPMIKDSFFPNFKKFSFDEVFEAMRDNIIYTCFNEISTIKAAELINLSEKHINPFTKENKSLISDETFKSNIKEKFGAEIENEDIIKLVKEDPELNKRITKMRSYYDLVFNELLTFEEKLATFIDSVSSISQVQDSLHKSKSKFVDNARTENYRKLNAEAQGERLDVFGVNLNDPKIKNTLGFSLLGLVILGIFLSYRAVVKKETTEEKPKKKKRGNQ